jgi:predicted aldo/keto reductase-like oxidoreductase
MLYRDFGKTGEKVSVLGFGCMRLPLLDPNDISKVDEPEAIKMIRHAIDNGVNYMDTAYPYHGTGFDKPGESEAVLAKALRDGYREKVKIATKLPSWLVQTHEDMERLLDEQLARLETDQIEFYLIHALNKNFWPVMQKNEFGKFLDKAKADGKIKYAGFSFHDELPLFKEILEAYDWDFTQIQYNFLDEDYQAGTEGLKCAAAKGIGIVIMEPLRGGNLAGDPPEAIANIWNKAATKRSAVEWALRWLFDKPEVSVVLSGMSTMEHVVDNLKIANQGEANSLTQEELKLVEEVRYIYHSRVKVNCTNCKYCMPCPVGVNIPKNFTSYNTYYLFDTVNAQHYATTLYGMTLTEQEKAKNCVACGKCESHCPQNIKIIEELKKVKDLFAPPEQ